MRALIMAGGAGRRLGLGEKPLIPVGGRPMIARVIDAFRNARCEPVAVVSPKTPMTANWCRANGILVFRAMGDGYIDDMVQAVHALGEDAPLFISVADIPCLDPVTVTTIMESYLDCGKDALSTWVPARMVRSCRESMPYREHVGGTEACPGGVNILRGDRIAEAQEEFALLLDDPGLSLNINTGEDLARAEAYLRESFPDSP